MKFEVAAKYDLNSLMALANQTQPDFECRVFLFDDTDVDEFAHLVSSSWFSDLFTVTTLHIPHEASESAVANILLACPYLEDLRFNMEICSYDCEVRIHEILQSLRLTKISGFGLGVHFHRLQSPIFKTIVYAYFEETYYEWNTWDFRRHMPVVTHLALHLEIPPCHPDLIAKCRELLALPRLEVLVLFTNVDYGGDFYHQLPDPRIVVLREDRESRCEHRVASGHTSVDSIWAEAEARIFNRLQRAYKTIPPYAS